MHHAEDFISHAPEFLSGHTGVRQGTEIVRDEFTPCGIAVGISSALVDANHQVPCGQGIIIFIQLL